MGSFNLHYRTCRRCGKKFRTITKSGKAICDDCKIKPNPEEQRITRGHDVDLKYLNGEITRDKYLEHLAYLKTKRECEKNRKRTEEIPRAM